MSKHDLLAAGVFAFGVGLMLGCTTAEWGQIASDGYTSGAAAAPEIGAAIASGNIPYAIGAGVALVLGIVYRSALRDFGSASGAKAAAIVRKILGPILSIFKK